MNQLSQETRACIEACLRCHAVCYAMAMTHCLETGGEHLRPQHYRLMMDCVIVCAAAADLMAHKSQFHHPFCGLCADVCEACAKSCEQLDGMELCIEACRTCAAACRAMA
jgi:hypothetical protein